MVDKPLPTLADDRALRFLFLDLNAYFASVEQQERPELRDLPVAVVPVEADSSFVIAASYEAKRFGVKTGTRIGVAKELCPDIRLVRATPHLYTKYHKAVIEAVETVLPVEKVCSIDEMYCRLLGDERDPGQARELALLVKRAIRERVGERMLASVGIASNIFLAKIATDMQKPDGLVILQSDDLPHALHRLQLTDLAGINKRMEARLHAAGIFSVEALCALDRDDLRRAWGSVVGERWWYKLRGVELNDANETGKSLSHSHVMRPDLRNDEGVKETLLRLLQKASARLRAEGLVTTSLTVSVSGKRAWQAHCRLDATSDEVTLSERLLSLWKSRDFERPMKASVWFTDLKPAGALTPSLFSQEGQRAELSAAIDGLNQKFGKHTVYLAGMSKAKNAAPERIAFQKVELFSEGKGDHEWPDTFRGVRRKPDPKAR